MNVNDSVLQKVLNVTIGCN